jgi:ankyrin repeat protein
MKNPMNIIENIRLLVLVMLGFAQISGTAEDYSKMSAEELNEALIIAVTKGSSDEVQKLIKAGADVNQKITYTKRNYDDYDDHITYAYLEYAAKCGCVDIVKELIRADAKNLPINTALILAAEEGHTNVVKELVQAKPTVDAINTALISAVGEFPGITTSPTTGFRYSTALKDYLNVIKELIKAGAHVNHTDQRGNTALIKVIESSLYTQEQEKNRLEVIQVLLKAKANVNHANKNGRTALMEAVREHHLNIVQSLLQVPEMTTGSYFGFGTKPINYADNDGNTALILAVKHVCYSYIDNQGYKICVDSQKIVEELLKTPGIDAHHVNNNGETAIKLLQELDEKLRSSSYLR